MSNRLIVTSRGFQKTIAALTSVATLLTLSGFVAFAPLVASAAAPADYGLHEGDRITANNTSGDPDIYIINDWGYKRLILSPTIAQFYPFLGTWPTQFLANTHQVSPATRDAFGYSGLFQVYNDNGTLADPKVWAYEFTGEDTGVIHWVNMTGDQAVAQDPQFFRKVFHINAPEFNWFTKSSVNYTSVSQIMTYSRTPGSTPTPTSTPTNGPVSVSLSPDNPAAGTVVAGQGIADLLHVRVSNPSASAVAVTSLKFQKLGIAGDSTFSNVYIYQVNGARLTDAVTPSSGIVSINGGTSSTNVVSVPAYGYVDLAIRSDIANSTSGLTVGMMLTQINGMAVSLSGNVFTIAAKPSDLSTAQFVAGSILPATGSTDPLHDSVVWQDTLTVSNKNVSLKSFALRQINSINNTDVSNFRLYVDGTLVATVANLDSNGYATFMPANGATILTGSRTIKVLADITGGTSRKLQMSLRASADVNLVDSNYGVNVTATLDTGNFPLNAGTLTINSGSIVVQKDVSSPSGNVVKGTSDAVLGRWLFTAYGEPTKVSTLITGLRLTNGSTPFVLGTSALRNGRVMAYPVGNPAAAQQFGSTTNLLYSNSASTSYTTNLTITPGSPMIVEVRADLYDNGDASDYTQATTTATATLYGTSSATNGQGMVSLVTSAVPSAIVAANQLTVQAGSMSISKYANFTNQTITTPRTGALIGDFVITGSTNEAVNVNTLVLDLTVGGSADLGDLSNVYLKWNGVPTSIKSTVGTGTSTTSSDQTYSVSSQLAVNGSVHVQVYADIGSRSSGTYQAKLEVQGTTVNSAQTVQTKSDGTSGTSGSVFSGQVMTIGSGNISSAVDAGSPIAANVTANKTYDVAKFNFIATNDTFNITEVQLKTLASSSDAGYGSVILKKADGTVLGSLPWTAATSVNSTATFGGLTGLTVNANDPNGLTLTAAVTSANVGVNAATSGLDVGITLNYFKNTNSGGTLSTDNNDRSGSHQYLYNSIPVVTAVSLPSTLLVGGTTTLSKFNVVGSGGTVGWNRILLTVAKGTNPNIASSGMQLFEDGVDISSNVTFGTHGLATGYTSGWIVLKANNSASEFQIPTSGHTYELKANVTNVTTSGDAINVTFTQPSSHIKMTTAASASFANGNDTASSSLDWTDRTDTNETGGHATTTSDWQNDYLIKSLPFTQAQTK